MRATASIKKEPGDWAPPMPEYKDIHPSMPRQLQEKLADFCELAGISFWDREKLYNQLQKGIV